MTTTINIDELYAKADRLLPAGSHSKLNRLLKENPLEFFVPDRVRLPQGTTHKALATLARDIYKAKEGK